MSILIEGIDMPTKGNPITVLIYPDGMAAWEAQNKIGTAIPVPSHTDDLYIIVYCTDNGKREETFYKTVENCCDLESVIKSLVDDYSVLDIIVARQIKHINAYQERKDKLSTVYGIRGCKIV